MYDENYILVNNIRLTLDEKEYIEKIYEYSTTTHPNT